ncbi:M55 family metallopeptidase [Lachnospiraceae bacterium 54-53]
MKLFISADIEGCAGVSFADETHKNEACYQRFAEQMTKEVTAVCEAAFEAGVEEIVVKDGHGDASNIDPLSMPPHVVLIRGKSGHPYNMMYGLDSSFDAALFVGYHAAAGDPGFSLSHTSTGNSRQIFLNGRIMSEFVLNSYTAASLGVPVILISGDEAICDSTRETVPGITCVKTKRGTGGAAYCVSPVEILEELKGKTKEALKHLEECRISLPDAFEYTVSYKDWKKAYQMSFYPGMESVDTFTNRLKTRRWLDVVTAHSFVVY